MTLPEMYFVVRWPDGSRMSCYSPSLVIEDYLAVGAFYTVEEFVERSRRALTIASERVEAKFGKPCVRAESQLAAIEIEAKRHGSIMAAIVVVEAFER